MRHDVERDLDRSQPQPDPPAPAGQEPATREALAGAIGNAAMQRSVASPGRAPAGLLSGAPMSVARFSASALAQRPSGALADYEEEEGAPDGPHETPPVEGSAPAEAPAGEPDTLEPVEESEPGSYDPMEESYI